MSYVLIVISLMLTLAYAGYMLFYLSGWITLKEFQVLEKNFRTKVTVIIPCRNEAAHIGNLLKDLMQQNYPQEFLEIIVADDFSEDQTCNVVELFGNITLLRMSEMLPPDQKTSSYKKRAIEAAVNHAGGELLITTDADCRINENWLATIVAYYTENNCEMILGPVLMRVSNKFIEKFQALDFVGLIGISAGSLHLGFPTMCNGANLAFKKSSFVAVNGFAGNDFISSGDDMFLMHKIWKKKKGSVHFLKNKDATVYTFPQSTLISFLNQRIRWTSKTRYYTDKRITLNLIIAYLFNLSLVINFTLALFCLSTWWIFIFSFLIKIIFEFTLLAEVTGFFKCGNLLRIFLPAQVVHIFYVLWVGIAGITVKPKWKGRTIE